METFEKNTYTITTTRTKVADVPAVPPLTVRVETRVRKPESKAYTVDIPTSLFTLENLLASSAQRRMTAAMLLGMWRSSSKYILDIAPKLQSYTGSQALRYAANIERHEKRLTALTGRSPETVLSASDLDKLLVNLHDDDVDTPFGTYLADRTEEVRSKLVEDSDAL